MSKRLDTIEQVIELALKADESKEYDCVIDLEEDGIKYSAYGVFVSFREMTFLCKDVTLTYMVDTYGDRHTIELFELDKR